MCTYMSVFVQMGTYTYTFDICVHMYVFHVLCKRCVHVQAHGELASTVAISLPISSGC